MLMKPNQYDAPVRTPQTQKAKPNAGSLVRIVRKVEDYLAYREQRRELLSLDDAMLRDIGLNRGEADRIANRPFRWFGEDDGQ